MTSKEHEQKKFDQLGMAAGTAYNRLRKIVLFELVKEFNRDTCFHCQEKIVKIKDLSIEHIIPWIDSPNPRELFFDLNNLSFSHLACNSRAARRPRK